MRTDHDQVDDDCDLRADDWADDDPARRDEEELTADIGSIVAGVTVVPAAIGWWRLRRERRGEKDAPSAGTTDRARRPRWFEL
jgi:hypothetical protein